MFRTYPTSRSRCLDFGGSRLDAEREVDDAVPLGADVQVVEPDAVLRHDESPLQETVDGAVPEASF
jgi:hypothetical protein